VEEGSEAEEGLTAFDGSSKLNYVTYKNVVLTSKKTKTVSITKINSLKVFTKLIGVYTLNHMHSVGKIQSW
jgi:hypothetical protein